MGNAIASMTLMKPATVIKRSTDTKVPVTNIFNKRRKLVTLQLGFDKQRRLFEPVKDNKIITQRLIFNKLFE